MTFNPKWKVRGGPIVSARIGFRKEKSITYARKPNERTGIGNDWSTWDPDEDIPVSPTRV